MRCSLQTESLGLPPGLFFVCEAATSCVAVGALDDAAVDRRQFAIVVELAKATLRHEAGKDRVRLGADDVVRCDGQGIAGRRWRGGLRQCECVTVSSNPAQI